MPHAASRRAVKPFRRSREGGNPAWIPAFAGMTLAALLCCAPAHAIYKWVDEKGVTHFSETPPPDGRKATKVEPKVTPPSSAPAAPVDWKKREQESRKQRIEREQVDEVAKAKAHNQAAERTNRCNHAKRDLEVLERNVPVFSTNARGERVYVEDKDRAAEIAAARREIEANCREP
jgi:hypothetical protein